MSGKTNFERTELLIGADAMRYMNAARVILLGVGGVGSWCAESLIRSGIYHLTLVDSDCISGTNINRQLPATTLTIGEAKVNVLKKRLLEINPEAEITAIQGRYRFLRLHPRRHRQFGRKNAPDTDSDAHGCRILFQHGGSLKDGPVAYPYGGILESTRMSIGCSLAPEIEKRSIARKEIRLCL